MRDSQEVCIMDTKKKISIKEMQHIGAIEKQLSQRSNPIPNYEFIPENSPLGMEIQRQKIAFGDDLSGLPPGHPLLKIIEEAKKRYEARIEAAKSQSNLKSKTASAKQKNAVNNRTVSDNEEKESARVRAAHKVNRCMEQVDEALKRLLKEIIDNEDLINTERVGRAHLFRLKRTADAMRRLLGETKIPGARA